MEYLILGILIVIVTYLGLLRYINDMRISSLHIKNLHNKTKDRTNILFIYPHPDDEVMNSAGLIARTVASSSFKVYAISTTHGEHGDEFLKVSPKELAEVRKKEYANVMHFLKVSDWEMWDYIDGNMQEQEQELQKQLSDFVAKNKIDLLVTYEKYGLYGHPDHISLSKSTNIIAKQMGLPVLYATLPDKILKRIDLPKTLTYKDKIVALSLDKIANPTLRLNVFRSLLLKYQVTKLYKSQSVSRGKLKRLLRWLFMPYEYYTTQHDS